MILTFVIFLQALCRHFYDIEEKLLIDHILELGAVDLEDSVDFYVVFVFGDLVTHLNIFRSLAIQGAHLMIMIVSSFDASLRKFQKLIASVRLYNTFLQEESRKHTDDRVVFFL